MFETLLLIAGIYIVLGAFEFHFPAEKGQSLSGKWRNVKYTLLLLITGEAATFCIYSLVPFPPRQLEPHGILFSLGIVILYTFLVDVVFYWYHRAEHSFSPLWPIHELHHSESELNMTTGMRTYWLERPIQTLLISTPIAYLIGLDRTALVILPFVLTGWLFFTHANLKLDLGFLTPWLTGPQLHRYHHSTKKEHYDSNFAQFFPVLDIVFGTYYKPKPGEFPKTGTPSLPSNTSVSETLVRPFMLWNKMIKRASKKNTSK